MNKIKKEWKESKGKVEPKVTEDDIAYIVSKWTGIPILKLEEKEQDKFLKMEDALHKRVIGQDEAISAIAHAVRRSRAGIKDPRQAHRLIRISRAYRRRQDAGRHARSPNSCSATKMR